MFEEFTDAATDQPLKADIWLVIFANDNSTDHRIAERVSRYRFALSDEPLLRKAEVVYLTVAAEGYRLQHARLPFRSMPAGQRGLPVVMELMPQVVEQGGRE